MAAIVGALAGVVSSAASAATGTSTNNSSAGVNAPSNPSLSRNNSSSTASPAHAVPAQGRPMQQGQSFRSSVSPSRAPGTTDAETDGDDEEADDGDGDGEDDDDDDNAYRKEGTGISAGDLMQENTVKSGYLWKKGGKRKVS